MGYIIGSLSSTGLKKANGEFPVSSGTPTARMKKEAGTYTYVG